MKATLMIVMAASVNAIHFKNRRNMMELLKTNNMAEVEKVHFNYYPNEDELAQYDFTTYPTHSLDGVAEAMIETQDQMNRATGYDITQDAINAGDGEPK